MSDHIDSNKFAADDVNDRKLAEAWVAVPDEYIPDIGNDRNLADAIRRMAADLESRSIGWQQVAESREATGEAEYRRGRMELAEELSSLVGEYLPSEGAWHYIMGALDIITGKAEVLR